KLPMLHPIELVGELGIIAPIFRDSRKPAIAQIFAAFADALTEMIIDTVGYIELQIFRPAVVPFRQPDLLFAQGLAMRTAGILLVRCAVSDMAIHNDQRGPILRILECPERTR